jgi:hypothetical protein
VPSIVLVKEQVQSEVVSQAVGRVHEEVIGSQLPERRITLGVGQLAVGPLHLMKGSGDGGLDPIQDFGA